MPIPGIEVKFPHFQPTTAHNCDLIHKNIPKTLNSYIFRTLLVHHHAVYSLLLYTTVAERYCLANVPNTFYVRMTLHL